MTAIRSLVQDQPPGEIEALLPWHAAGTLNPRESRRIDAALAKDAELARLYDAIRDEHAEIVLLHESLGAPSLRARQKLFAAIDAEPIRAGASDTFARLVGPYADLPAPGAGADRFRNRGH
ncbi:MAG: hypothetical protein JWQ94_1605 [Tardiphaga sp.]|jgi:hypothetical protein|nr:hypothetical protein [Tardiphaga sp.]